MGIAKKGESGIPMRKNIAVGRFTLKKWKWQGQSQPLNMKDKDDHDT